MQGWSRILSQLAMSNSIAANFDKEAWTNYIPINADDLKALDLIEIQATTIKKAAEHRKTLQARFGSSTAVPIAQSASQSQSSPFNNEETEKAEDIHDHAKEGDEGHKVGENVDDKDKDDIKKRNVTSPVQEDPTPTLPVHTGIFCDGCKANPIIGTRWKCLKCSDYDLCEACHSKDAHEHKDFLPIEDPDDYKALYSTVSHRHLFNHSGKSSSMLEE